MVFLNLIILPATVLLMLMAERMLGPSSPDQTVLFALVGAAAGALGQYAAIRVLLAGKTRSIKGLTDEIGRLAASSELGRVEASGLSADLVPLANATNALIRQATRRERQITEILDLIHQAILTFGPDLKVNESYSPIVHKIFGAASPVGRDVVELLYSDAELDRDAVRQMDFHFRGLFGMGSAQWQVSALAFVRQAVIRKVRNKIDVRYEYYPIYDDAGRIARIMVVVEDVTQLNKAKQQADRKQREMEKIFALVQVSDTIFNSFREETSILFDKLKAELKQLAQSDETNFRPVVARMFRHVHTIKANSKLFKLTSILDVAHEVETYLADLRDGAIPFERDVVAALPEKLNEINEEIYSYTTLRREILGRQDKQYQTAVSYRIQWIRSLVQQFYASVKVPSINLREIDRIQWELSRALASFEKSSLGEYLTRYDAMAREMAERMGKKVEAINHTLQYRYFAPAMLNRVNDILVHLIRNSLDHGIEAPDERVQAGKPEAGHLSISCFLDDGWVTLQVRDDGRGIDPEAVIERAIERGFVSNALGRGLTDSQKIDFIFQPGFTTADRVSELSGRGVGLDAVRAVAQELGGTVKIDPTIGQGVTFTVRFPEARDDFMTTFAIFDVQSVLRKYQRDFEAIFNLARVKFVLKNHAEDERMLVLGDQLAVTEVLKTVCLDLLDVMEPGASLVCTLESFRGRRRVDSHEFYRMTLTSDRGFGQPLSAEWPGMKRAIEVCKRQNGTVRILEPELVQINVPSCMPVSVSEYTIPILLYVSHSADVERHVHEYFKTYLGNWAHDVLCINDPTPGLADHMPKGSIVILQEANAHLYEATRAEALRKSDSLVLVAENSDGIDNLDLIPALPENIIFTPGPLRKSAIAQLLEAVIMRRFAGEMIRQGPSTSELATMFNERRAS